MKAITEQYDYSNSLSADYDDYTCEVIQDLHDSDINLSISWISTDHINVQLGDQEHGVLATEELGADVSAAVAWLRTKACELFPSSRFADRYGPPYESPYLPSTPEARAAGCICDWRDPDGDDERVEPRCPEHGFSSLRMINGQLVEVGRYWRPDRAPDK